jgi:cell division protein FtsQ
VTDAPVEQATPRLRMDPRIRERRVAVRRDEGRRRLRLLLIAGGVVLAIAVAFAVTRSPLLDVDRIDLRGATNTSAAEVAEAAGLTGKPQLADLDPELAVARIERLPWVQEATVIRHWPGTVEVDLVERVPAATVPAAAGGWAVVDRTGRVLAAAPEPGPGLVQVASVAAPAPGEEVAPDVQGALRVLDALPPSLSERVNGLTVAEDGTIEVHAVNLPIIHFGPPTQVRPKLVALATLVARTDLRGVDAIDVRVPTAPVLTGR